MTHADVQLTIGPMEDLMRNVDDAQGAYLKVGILGDYAGRTPDETGVKIVCAFLATYPRARFAQLTAGHAARISQRFGYYATPMGIEARLDLARFSWAGSKREKLRTSIRRAAEQAAVGVEDLRDRG